MGSEIWPSLDVASRVADWANTFFIGSLVVGVASTILIVWMSNVKEGHWNAARVESAERIAELDTKAEALRARNLALEQAIAPRELEQFHSANNLKLFSHIRYLIISESDTEARRTAAQIRFVLAQAGWKKYEGEPPPPSIIPDAVTIRSGRPAEMDPANPPRFDAEHALIRELTAAGVETRPGITLPGWPSDFVLIQVGLKPMKNVSPPSTGGITIRGNMLFD